MRGQAFELYETCPEIQAVERQLENVTGGEYSFNDFGDLCYLVEVPKELRDLPFINDYLTRDFASIWPTALSCGNDLYIYQTCGPCITINEWAERGDYSSAKMESSVTWLRLIEMAVM
jgi:hypothetical protein